MKRFKLTSMYLIACIVMIIGNGLYLPLHAQAGEKIIPPSVDSAATQALSHYPELDDVYIEFVFKKHMGGSFMEAQPKMARFFRKGEKRKYVIKMTSRMVINDDTIPVSEIPHQVLVGWFAHELGHVMDYIHRNSLNLMWFGVKYYISDSFKSVAERNADIFAIEHGLSEEIIATKEFILSNASLPEEYIAKIERLYLSPANILELVQELEEKQDEGELDEENVAEELIEEQT